MYICDKQTGEVKIVYSVEIRGERAYVRFSEGGKEYGYGRDRVEVLEESALAPELAVYQFAKECYRCGQSTEVLTYIVFDDGTDENVTYPWDKARLLEHQDIWAHLRDSSIEYYGLKVIGEDEALDQAMMQAYPDRIQRRFSKTQRRSYPMNLCQHCRAAQGWNFIFRQVNEMIKEMKPIQRLN